MNLSFDDDARLRGLIDEHLDFPKPGVRFRDIQPLLEHADAFDRAIQLMLTWCSAVCPDKPRAFVGIESRGFVFSAALAQAATVGKVMLRKPGKLPGKVEQEHYDLEYGQATLEVGAMSIRRGASYFVVDDVLATGGTARAACRLVERLGGKIAGCLFLAEIKNLEGRLPLIPHRVASLIKY